MSLLADYLDETSKRHEDDSSNASPARVNESDVHSSRLHASPGLAVPATRFTPGLPRPILKRDSTAVSFAGDMGSSTLPEPSPIKSSYMPSQKKLSFAADQPLRPFSDFSNAPMSKPMEDCSPSTQRFVEKYRDNVTRALGVESPLFDRNHFHHMSPLVKLTRSDELIVSAMEPIIRKPLDTLLEGQVALLDQHVQQRIRHCEELLGKPITKQLQSSQTNQIATKLHNEVERQRRAHYITQQQDQPQLKGRGSPSLPASRVPPVPQDNPFVNKFGAAVVQRSLDATVDPHKRFLAGGKVNALSPVKHLTGREINESRRERSEAIRRLQALERNDEVRRQKRILNSLATFEHQASIYRAMIAEQDAARLEQEKGRIGSKMTTQELIAQWRNEVEATVESDAMEESRDRARSLRKAIRAEKEELKRAEEILSGLTSLQLEEKRKKALESKSGETKKRWRITKMGSVDVFDVPRWSSRPKMTLSGDVVVEEEDSTVINHVTWIDSNHGWIPVQLTFNGYSRTQLFAEAPRDEGDGVVNAMLDELDDAYEKIIDAVTHCPPEQLKSQVEVKELMKQAEFVRQGIRDLPDGRRDLIRKIWDEMQSKGTSKLVRDQEGRADAGKREPEELGEHLAADDERKDVVEDSEARFE